MRSYLVFEVSKGTEATDQDEAVAFIPLKCETTIGPIERICRPAITTKKERHRSLLFLWRHSCYVKRRRINPIGPRTRKWRKIRDEVVNPELAARGISHCEFAGYLPGKCWGRLERAHSMKRNKLKSDEDWAEAALSCSKHHKYMDEVLCAVSHEEMLQAVKAAIARRPPPIDFSTEEERQAMGGEPEEIEAEALPWLETPF